MLRQAYGGFDVLHLKLFQQSLQLWKLLFRKRYILHCFGELVERLQFSGEVCEKGSVGKNTVIVEDNGIFPIQGAKLLLCRGQFRFGCRKVQCHRARIFEVRMQAKGQAEQVAWLRRQSLGAGRRSSQLTVTQHITVSNKDAVFPMTHHSADTGKVQHFKDGIRHSLQFWNKIVFCVKPAEGSIVCGIHYMITVGLCADSQISHILHCDDTAVGVYFFLHLHGEQSLKGDPLYLIQRRKPCGKVVELVETDIQLL